MEEQFKDVECLVKEAGLNTPSANFLNNVMCNVETIKNYQEKAYKPLISKRSWLVIAMGVISLICLTLFLPDTKNSIFSEVNLSIVKIIKINDFFSGFKFYKTTVYGIVFLAVLFFIQVSFLKRRIDKSFS
ncbi:hypothetical protein [Aquimarina longa]|uniref:hypothetical protein n=1 Tax=Aquimarina longa TaxID=1080221 RepID=UPI000783205F|nr:hypothetical protein [Aquimarina longa]